tara:strand:- start:56 stop:544 length:489 start_codon:yes stop_codon:yes gene_type:complete
MTDLNKLLNPLFLRDIEIKKIIELLFFSYRDFTAGPDAILEKINFGRAHHRVIYFVGKQKNLTIKELLLILQITKQSLSRVLNQLVKEKYIVVSVGEDKRTKKLTLTQKGQDLEDQLTMIQTKRIKKIINKFSEKDINGFKKILYAMIEQKNKIKFDEINNK